MRILNNYDCYVKENRGKDRENEWKVGYFSWKIKLIKMLSEKWVYMKIYILIVFEKLDWWLVIAFFKSYSLLSGLVVLF